MKRSRFWLSLAMTITLMLFYGTTLATAAGSEHALKVGKRGEIRLRIETKVGDLTLNPGRYKLKHRVDGADHFVRFTEWTERQHVSGSEGVPKDNSFEVRCTLEPLDAKVRRTTAYKIRDGLVLRLTKVEVRGENVAHLF